MSPIVAARLPTRTIAAMPQPDRNPLAATRRLLVDGTNLLYALSKTATASPPAALIGRLRGVIPAATTIELVFDGPPERGLRNERIASGVVVRYSGGRTADNVILTMIEDVRLIDGPDGTATLLIVTDDRDLRLGARLRRGHCVAPDVSRERLQPIDARRLADRTGGALGLLLEPKSGSAADRGP